MRSARLWKRLLGVEHTVIEQVSYDGIANLYLQGREGSAVHALRAIRPEEWGRTLRHPERGVMTLDANLQLYEWHGRHHVAHITTLRQRAGW